MYVRQAGFAMHLLTGCSFVRVGLQLHLHALAGLVPIGMSGVQYTVCVTLTVLGFDLTWLPELKEWRCKSRTGLRGKQSDCRRQVLVRCELCKLCEYLCWTYRSGPYQMEGEVSRLCTKSPI